MRDGGGGFYSGGGGVGATPCHPCMESLYPGIRIMHHGITLRKSRGYSTSKMGLIGLTGGSAGPFSWPFGPIFGGRTPCGLLVLSMSCILCGTPISYGLWALLLSETQD